MNQEYNFPDYMLSQVRWMSRTRGTKLPFSALAEKPEGVDNEKWRYAWNDRRVWATFEEALLETHSTPDQYDGLCYVLHPGGEDDEALRLICFDFDKCIDDSGNIDPEVLAFVKEHATFAEVSINGHGVHVFMLVRCKPFKNALQRDFGSCKVDILCSSQVAVTGTVYDGQDTLREVAFDVIEKFALKDKQEKADDIPDIWSEEFEPKGSVDHLVQHMEEWEPCYRSSKGSQLGEGGDVEFFRAACHLARNGVTGEAARELLTYVPQDPVFEEEEARHKIESAFRSVWSEDEFGAESAACEFDIIPDTRSPEEKIVDRYGFTPIALDELEEMDLDVSFVVEGLLVDKEGLFIGGREKSFKTGIAADLALSLTTGAPFLNNFEVLGDRKKVAFFTAEIGLRAAKSLFNRIRRAKGIDAGTVHDIDIIDSLPTFQLNPHTNKPVDPRAINGLKQYFADAKPDVAVFDPLYLAMTGAAVGDMYAIGGVLNNMNAICRMFDVWPIFCHHARKDQSKEFEAMQLGDFYGSGVSAFARQWLLMSHAEPFYQGRASLYCNAGGSAAGDCGLHRVEIFEGKSDELLDRKWRVTVTSEDGEEVEQNHEESILNALNYFGVPQSVASIADYAELDNPTAKKVLIALVKTGRADMLNGKYQIGDA